MKIFRSNYLEFQDFINKKIVPYWCLEFAGTGKAPRSAGSDKFLFTYCQGNFKRFMSKRVKIVTRKSVSRKSADLLKVIFIALLKCPAKKLCAWKCAGKAIKHSKSASKSVNKVKRGSFYSFALKSQTFAQVVANFA